MASSVPFTTPRGGPLNTPTSRTPSASISLDPAEAAWVRGGGASRMRCSIDDAPREADEMDEDERMVEDILLSSPTSPSNTSPSFSRPPLQSSVTQASALRGRKSSLSLHMAPLDHPHQDLPSPNTSLFANTDPFYLASLQSSHSHAPPASAFAQVGRPSTHSPFLTHYNMQSMYGSFGHPYQPGPTDVQHNMFAATAAAFSS